MDARSNTWRSVFRCSNCLQALAHDQRYCLDCGARRGPLPAHIAAVIGGIFEQGRRVPAAGLPATEVPGGAMPDPRAPWHDWVIAPRSAAAAVMGMLGFGALVGSMVGGGVAGPLQTLLVMSPSINKASSLASGAGSGGDSSGGPATITVQDTITQGGGGSAVAVAASGNVGGNGGNTVTTPPLPNTSNLPPIKHVFMIVLSGQGYQQSFGHATNDPYLAQQLVRKGVLIPNYYSVAGGSLANEIALLSGQGPTPQTVKNCPSYKDIRPGTKGANAQVLGQGCVYPKTTQSLATQLTAAKHSWKAYVQVAGAPKEARLETCAPKPGSSDPTQPGAVHPYASWRNPLLYFRAVVGKAASCPKTNVPLKQLATDLKSADTTPSLSYIVPDICDDGGAVICDVHGRSGLAASDAFLKTVVPEIERSPAYKADGMIAITFDQAPQTGLIADSSSCCDTPTYPNLPPPTPGSGTGGTTTSTGTSPTSSPTTTGTTTTSTSPTTTSTSPTTTTPGASPGLGSGQTSPTGGGGQVGLLVLSKYVQPNTQDVTDYFNHFSLLASIEELFSLKRLGYTTGFNLPVFGPAVWSKYVPGA
jgi:phosphatidylinositol-3-phosphatase